MVIGDFNIVLFSHERSSGLLGMGNKNADFVAFIHASQLIDLGFSGPAFSWVRGNSQETFAGARLDRALGNAG